MKIIELSNLKKNYHTNKVITEVLRGINLNIDEGEFVSIIGPSGSGKTTLLYVMSGLESYDSGSVKLFGKEVNTYKNKEISFLRQKKVGFIFQFYNLIPNLTVYENILLAITLANNDNEKDIDKVLDFVGLLDYKNYYPSQISGGMQQRVAIARCLINDPDIIFADEPTGNLDYHTGQMIMELFAKLNKELNKTIVLVTHNEEMIKFGTRYLKLRDGVVIADEKINI
ncbi:MAG TPA: ABC transporter ATP-binding protein [Haloplasmataceae bacterium]